MGAGRRRWEGQSWKLGDVEKSVPQQHRGSTPNANATAPDGFRLIARMESSAHFPLTYPPADSPEESNQHNPLARVNRRGWWWCFFFSLTFSCYCRASSPRAEQAEGFQSAGSHTPGWHSCRHVHRGGKVSSLLLSKAFQYPAKPELWIKTRGLRDQTRTRRLSQDRFKPLPNESQTETSPWVSFHDRTHLLESSPACTLRGPWSENEQERFPPVA